MDGRVMAMWTRAGMAAFVAAGLCLPVMSGGRVAAQEPAEDAAVPVPCDFATSGGFIALDSGKKASFGAHGGCKNAEFWGHVNYVDHETGLHVSSLEVTGYVQPFGVPNPRVRDVCGIAATNRDDAPVYFRVRLIDNGEPGTLDQFGIRLSSGYHVSTRLLSTHGRGGGDVQLHDPNASTVAPAAIPSLGDMCHGLAAPGASGGGGGVD